MKAIALLVLSGLMFAVGVAGGCVVNSDNESESDSESVFGTKPFLREWLVENCALDQRSMAAFRITNPRLIRDLPVAVKMDGAADVTPVEREFAVPSNSSIELVVAFQAGDFIGTPVWATYNGMPSIVGRVTFMAEVPVVGEGLEIERIDYYCVQVPREGISSSGETTQVCNDAVENAVHAPQNFACAPNQFPFAEMSVYNDNPVVNGEVRPVRFAYAPSTMGEDNFSYTSLEDVGRVVMVPPRDAVLNIHAIAVHGCASFRVTDTACCPSRAAAERGLCDRFLDWRSGDYLMLWGFGVEIP